MKQFLKPTFATLSLFCALSGLTLAGCNRDSGSSSGGMTGVVAGSSSDSLATVGTAKITRADLDTFLEAQSGEQTLPILIDTQLVFEALKTKSLEVSDAEVNADLARRQAADPSLAAFVTAGGPRLSLIKIQIKRELAVQKLLTAEVTATDAQVKSFFDKNRAYYDQPAKVKIGMLLASTKTRADLMAAQLKGKTKTLAQLVAEQKKVADPVASNSTESEQLSRFPPLIAGRVTPLIAKLGKGGVTPVQNFGGQAYAIFVVDDKTPVVKADFAKLQSDVTLDYKNAEIAKKTVAANKRNPPFDETVKRTYESLKVGNPAVGTPPNPAVTLRDTLNFINQSTVSNLISGLRTAGTVQIDDAAYAKVAVPYQAAPAAGAAGNAATANAATANAATGNAATAPAATGNSATGNTATAPAAP